jgi:choline dehydrogenase-like flavoprotein
MYRLREIDFQAIEMENSEASAWPITYGELEPYYCEAEYLYKVHGSSDNDPSEPPRSMPWPYQPIPHQGPTVELVSKLTERGGVPVSYIPRALDYDPSERGRRVLCQHCDAYYCPRDAKMDAEIAALRPALRTGLVKLLTNTRCLQVLVAPDGKKVIGVRVQRNGTEYTIHAGVVAVCAGLVESPLLLWRSRNSKHLNGLANSSGTLGRNMAAHAGLALPNRARGAEDGIPSENFRHQCIL